MLIIFAFNVMFWMFFEQAGSSFTFLAENIVNRQFGSWTFPTAWFQSVNSVAIITLAPVIARIWVAMGRANPSIPRKFGLGLLFNGAAFALLMFALSQMVVDGKIPFWTLFMVYVIQSVGELCLSPIGLSMVTKLAPVRPVGFGMGGWFLSTGIGNNLSGIFAGVVSGEGGMTVESALKGYTFGFWALIGSGVVLFLIAPLINKLMMASNDDERVEGMRSKLGTAVVVVCAALIGACSQPQPPATAEPTQPLDTRPTEPPVADPSEPVASATPGGGGHRRHRRARCAVRPGPQPRR